MNRCCSTPNAGLLQRGQSRDEESVLGIPGWQATDEFGAGPNTGFADEEAVKSLVRVLSAIEQNTAGN
jgi:hypothetical protein